MKTHTTHKISSKKSTSPFLQVFGIGFFLVGVIAILTGNLLGIIFCVVSILFFIKSGTELALHTRQYRTFSELFGFRFGPWKALPEIDYVSVFKATETIIVRDLVKDTKLKNDVIVLNLFYNGNHRIKAYTTISKEDAFKVAKQIAEILKIDILDATEVESKWI
jgi:hypothetical protein